jgi:hypothetical protein
VKLRHRRRKYRPLLTTMAHNSCNQIDARNVDLGRDPASCGYCELQRLAWYIGIMNATFSSLSDSDLLTQLERVCAQERNATAQVVALLMEVDARKLYAPQSCSSLFSYCVQVLHFSEHAAYLRIEAARAARRFPLILDRLADGSVHLTAVSLLASHLTAANHVELLDAARHKSKRHVEQLVASARPQPDVPTVVRKLPQPRLEVKPEAPLSVKDPTAGAIPPSPAVASASTLNAEIKPLAPERFKVQFTVSRGTYEKLRQVQNLLRHTIRDGDPAAIFDRALTLLLADLSKSKFASTEGPRPGRKTSAGSRHIPAAVKREVWRRDGGQCAFIGELGRCRETGFLEFHHVVPYARGGSAATKNIELRCRAHNAYEAQQVGLGRPTFLVRETKAEYGTRLGPDRVHGVEADRRQHIIPSLIRMSLQRGVSRSGSAT